MTEDDDLEAMRLEILAERQRTRNAHPFGPDLPHTTPQVVYDDERPSSALLVAFPGDADRMGAIQTPEFFAQVADIDTRRVLVRHLHAVLLAPHELGATVEEVSQSLRSRVAAHSPTVFVGTSIGGFVALLFGTLLGVDHIVLSGPTTCVKPDFLEKVGDQRYAATPLPEEWLARYGDPAQLWSREYAPQVTLFYPYREDYLRGHAEHLASYANVRMVPRYERAIMASLRDSGEMTALLRSLLDPPPAVQPGPASEVTELRQELDRVQAEYAKMFESRSWRWTKPLRRD